MPSRPNLLLSLLLLSVLLSAPAHSQVPVLDSLRTASSADPANKQLKAQLQLQSGIHHYRQRAFDRAVIFLNNALSLGQSIPDKQVQIKAFNNLGNVFADKGDNPKALNNYQQALKIAEADDDQKNIAHLNKNIGALYMSWQRFDDALRYYKLAHTTAGKIGDSSLIADCLNNMGTVYEQQAMFPQALSVYQSALTYYEKSSQPDRVAMTLTNIAIVYKALKDYPSSIKYNEQAMALSLKIGDKWMAAAILNNIGNTYGELGNYTKAVEFCQRALVLAREIDAQEIVINAYESMASAAAKVGDYKMAYAYHQSYLTQKDSFINAESTRQLSELQVRYETQKKEAENAKLLYENQKANQEKQATLAIAIGSIVFLLTIFLLAVRNTKIRSRAREEKGMNKALFEGEQKERIRIARDLHDSIGQKLSVVRMQLSNLPAATPSGGAFHETIGLVDDTITEVRSISHNLIPEELNFGLAAALVELADKTSRSGKVQVVVSISEEVRNTKLPQSTELSLYRVVQEVMGNILKHAHATDVNINVSSSGAALHVTISDNGHGFDTGLISKSTGIGWKNIFARIRLMNGDIDLRSDKRSGTQVLINIPI